MIKVYNYNELNIKKVQIINAFLSKNGLSFDKKPDYCVVIYENLDIPQAYIKEDFASNFDIVAFGAIDKKVLKYLCVDEKKQGMGYLEKLITILIEESIKNKIDNLFIFTKPSKCYIFMQMGFSLICETNKISMLEHKSNGISNYLNDIKNNTKNIKINDDKNLPISSIVCNLNPMTLGHLKLIQKASAESSILYIFLLSEDNSFFKFEDRLEMLKKETSNLKNVQIVLGSDYVISSSTFPTYFIKDKKEIEITQMELDATLFAKRIAPFLNIKRRYVGTEPLDIVTSKYNEVLKNTFKNQNIQLIEVERFKNNNEDIINATKVREILNYNNYSNTQKIELIKKYVPLSTIEIIKEKYLNL
ncbi:MAG: hypothetical protein Q4F88_01935 [Eubacteriales bacterium]|nr:hypothetical protein [Eubacteriales bacterium]